MAKPRGLWQRVGMPLLPSNVSERCPWRLRLPGRVRKLDCFWLSSESNFQHILDSILEEETRGMENSQEKWKGILIMEGLQWEHGFENTICLLAKGKCQSIWTRAGYCWFLYSQNNHQPKIGLPWKKVDPNFWCFNLPQVQSIWVRGNRKFENYLRTSGITIAFGILMYHLANWCCSFFYFAMLHRHMSSVPWFRFQTQAPCISKSPAVPFCMVKPPEAAVLAGTFPTLLGHSHGQQIYGLLIIFI